MTVIRLWHTKMPGIIFYSWWPTIAIKIYTASYRSKQVTILNILCVQGVSEHLNGVSLGIVVGLFDLSSIIVSTNP